MELVRDEEKIDYEAYLLRAQSLNSLKNFKEAIVSYTSAIDINKYTDDYYSRGLIYLKILKFRKAYKDLKICLDNDLKSERLLDALLDCAINLKEYKEVLKYADELILINKDCEKYYFLKAESLLKLEVYRESISNYQKAISINPKNDKAFQGLGNAYYEMEKLEEAKINYKKAISINSNNKEVLDMLKLLEE